MIISLQKNKIRYGVVGLGYIAQSAVLPAFKNAKSNSKLEAIISRDKQKLQKLGKKYHVDHCFLFKDLEQLLQNKIIDVLYICTPNWTHKEIMLVAAKYGVHVLCEKAMSISFKDCEQMIEQAEKNHISLMIAYRLHFEAANIEALKIAHSKRLGEPKLIQSVFTFNVEDRLNSRLLSDEEGGGPLYDIGIYCINSARHFFKAEPIEVYTMASKSKDPRFSKTEESLCALLKFSEERMASFTISFSSFRTSYLEVIGQKGRIRLENAFNYAKPMEMKIFESGKMTKKKFPKRDQFAPEIIYFSECVQKKKKPDPSGLEGSLDIKIIEALLLSKDLGSPIKIDGGPKKFRSVENSVISCPPVARPKLFHASSPTEKAGLH